MLIKPKKLPFYWKIKFQTSNLPQNPYFSVVLRHFSKKLDDFHI